MQRPARPRGRRPLRWAGAAAVGVGLLATTTVPAAAATAPPLHPQTARDLRDAMHGEAFAYATYLADELRARQENRPDAALLFRNTAPTERRHFSEEAALAGVVGSDEQNLNDAIAGESYEVGTMYRRYAGQARAAGDVQAAQRFEEIRSDEAVHRDDFAVALRELRSTRTDAGVPRGQTLGPADLATDGRPPTPQTRQNLLDAMHGEAFAHLKYQMYAAHARLTNHPRLAALFERTARVEREQHFAEEGALAGLVQTARQNLRDAAAGETYEARTMYPEYARQARAAGDRHVAKRFEEIARDEAVHATEFGAASGPDTSSITHSTRRS